MGFPGGSEVKNLLANAGDLSSIPGSGRPPGGGHGKPTPVFLPGESHRQRSWMGCSPWGCTESDTTEATKQQQQGRNTLTGIYFFSFCFVFRPHCMAWGFPGGSDGRESACNAGGPGLVPGSGRSPRGGNGNPLPVVLPGEFQGQRSLPWHVGS